MCLSKVTQTENLPKEGFGWKVFEIIEGKLWPEYFGTGPYKPNHWYKASEKARSCKIKTFFGYCYPAGFHVFLKKKDAKQWHEISKKTWGWQKITVVKKIKFRKPIVRGLQAMPRLTRDISTEPTNVIVAEEMRVLK